MAQLEVRRITDMFEYLNQGTPNLAPSDGAFVFGRKDPRLAKLALDLFSKNLINWALFTGGIGKDSEDLDMPEALYLAAKAVKLGFPAEQVFVETAASNGAENSRFGLKAISDKGFRPSTLTVVAHATSLRRLVMQLQFEINQLGLGIQLQAAATSYPFDPTFHNDALEASQEMVRMADWPAVYGYPENSELDQDLVAYARRVVSLLGK